MKTKRTRRTAQIEVAHKWPTREPIYEVIVWGGRSSAQRNYRNVTIASINRLTRLSHKWYIGRDMAVFSADF